MKLIKIVMTLVLGMFALSAFATNDAPRTEWINIDGTTQPVTVTMARITMDDSTVRKGGIRIFSEVKSSSSAASSIAGGSGPGWVTSTPLVSTWAYYSKTYPNAWTPAAYRQKVNFDQTTIPVITQERYVQNREYNASTGEYRNLGSPVRETRTYNAPSETRTVVVTPGPVTSSTACSSWTPDESTVTKGQSFTQTRSCSNTSQQVYSFSIGYSWTDSWANGGSTTESRTSTGTYQINDWVTVAGNPTAWVAIGTHYTDWSPAPYRQTSDFTQTRTLMYDRERYVQKREYSPSTGEYRDVGAPVRETDSTPSGSESRLVNVVAGPQVEVGPRVGCSAYTPDASTIKIGTAFTQSRTCSTTYRTTYSFSIGYSWSNDTGGTVVDSSQGTGTKPYTWQPRNLRDYRQFIGGTSQGSEKSGACDPNVAYINSFVTAEWGWNSISNVYYWEQRCEFK